MEGSTYDMEAWGKWQVTPLTSSMDLGPHGSVDVTLRYVDELPAPALDSYYELSSSVGWRVWNTVGVSVRGFNLLDDRHFEYPAPGGNFTPRSVLAQARWRF